MLWQWPCCSFLRERLLLCARRTRAAAGFRDQVRTSDSHAAGFIHSMIKKYGAFK